MAKSSAKQSRPKAATAAKGSAAADRPALRVANFNCNSVRQRIEHIIDWLAANQPDLLALQETKVVDDLFPAEAFEAAGYHVVYRGQKSYNGVAVATRAPVASSDFGLRDGDDDESGPRLAHVVYEGIDVINTYVPQGRDLDSEAFTFKLAWFQRLRAYLDKHCDPAKPVLWLGDLNVAPQPMDVHDSKKVWPHVCHCQEVIDAFQGVVDFGFIDLFRKHLPDPETFTYWDYRVRGAVDRGVGWRIDHLLATPPLAERSRAAWVDVEARRREKPSDHTFVTVDFAPAEA